MRRILGDWSCSCNTGIKLQLSEANCSPNFKVHPSIQCGAAQQADSIIFHWQKYTDALPVTNTCLLSGWSLHAILIMMQSEAWESISVLLKNGKSCSRQILSILTTTRELIQNKHTDCNTWPKGVTIGGVEVEAEWVQKVPLSHMRGPERCTTHDSWALLHTETGWF